MSQPIHTCHECGLPVRDCRCQQRDAADVRLRTPTLRDAALAVHNAWVAEEADLAAFDGQGSPDDETPLRRAMGVLGGLLWENGRLVTSEVQKTTHESLNVPKEVKP